VAVGSWECFQSAVWYLDTSKYPVLDKNETISLILQASNSYNYFFSFSCILSILVVPASRKRRQKGNTVSDETVKCGKNNKVIVKRKKNEKDKI
jgi:hypothetical protein